MQFTLTPQQIERLAKWKESLPSTPKTAIGGAFTYSFTPTSLGIVINVRYFNGNELDLTEYEEW